MAGELLDIAKSSDVDAYRIWSLRAYARVVSLPSDRPPQTTLEMLSSAMNLATRHGRQGVDRLATGSGPRARMRWHGCSLTSTNPNCKNAAVPAVFTLAKGLSQSHPDQARAALEKIRPLTDDAGIRQQIPKVLRNIDARKQQ